MSGDPLAQLRPIHWPEPVSWWPPAPGWWLLGLLLIVVIAVWWRRRRPTPAAPESVEPALPQLVQQADSDREFIAALNQLLKQVALVHFPPEEVAALSGEQWLAFLDASGGDGAFCDGPGRVLELGPYQASVRIDDRDELLNLCRQWIGAVTNRHEAE